MELTYFLQNYVPRFQNQGAGALANDEGELNTTQWQCLCLLKVQCQLYHKSSTA